MFNMMIQRWYSTIIRLKVDVIDWNKVYDNRDISLLNSHNHSVQPMIEDSIKKATHADDIMWLGYRFALFQLMTMLSLQAIDYVADKAVQIDNFATCAEYVAKIKEKFELLPELSKVNKQTVSMQSLFCVRSNEFVGTVPTGSTTTVSIVFLFCQKCWQNDRLAAGGMLQYHTRHSHGQGDHRRSGAAQHD